MKGIDNGHTKGNWGEMGRFVKDIESSCTACAPQTPFVMHSIEHPQANNHRIGQLPDQAHSLGPLVGLSLRRHLRPATESSQVRNRNIRKRLQFSVETTCVTLNAGGNFRQWNCIYQDIHVTSSACSIFSMIPQKATVLWMLLHRGMSMRGSKDLIIRSPHNTTHGLLRG